MENELLNGLIGGLIPSTITIIGALLVLAGRLARMETDIRWLIKELKGSRFRAKDRTS